jgi:hypothetical protein
MLGWKTSFPRLRSILTGNLLETIKSLGIGPPFSVLSS